MFSRASHPLVHGRAVRPKLQYHWSKSSNQLQKAMCFQSHTLTLIATFYVYSSHRAIEARPLAA